MTADKCTSKYGRENCAHHGTRIANVLPPRSESDAKLTELHARIFTTHSRTELIRLEDQREAVQLDADASPEGLTDLLKRALASRADDPFRFSDDQRLARAKAHYATKLTETAVSDYKTAGNRNYQRLFFDTNIEPYERDGRVHLPEESSEGVADHSFATNDPDFDAKVITLREQVGARLADAARYNSAGLDLDLARGRHAYTAPAQDSTGKVRHVIAGNDPDVVIARVEFNENGAFQRATVAHPSGDGSVTKLDTPAAFRSFLDRAKKDATVAPLPSYVTGRLKWATSPEQAPKQPEPDLTDALF